MDPLLYFVIFVVGLAFGSFASVIIHRLHTREGGILAGRSKCPRCSHTLGFRDLIPVVSFVLSGFKCRYCKSKISFHYPILELTMGGFFVLTAYLVGFESSAWLAYYLFLTFVFVLISFYDIFFQEIPDEISLPTIVLTGLVSYFGGLYSSHELLLGVGIPVVFFGLLFFGSRGRWLGGGDVRLGAIMGFSLGWPLILVGLFLSYLVGSIYSLVGLATKKLHRKSPIPFGPFLLLGTYAALFWGDRIVAWYLSYL